MSQQHNRPKPQRQMQSQQPPRMTIAEMLEKAEAKYQRLLNEAAKPMPSLILTKSKSETSTDSPNTST